jgi:hypothetical protein
MSFSPQNPGGYPLGYPLKYRQLAGAVGCVAQPTAAARISARASRCECLIWPKLSADIWMCSDHLYSKQYWPPNAIKSPPAPCWVLFLVYIPYRRNHPSLANPFNQDGFVDDSDFDNKRPELREANFIEKVLKKVSYDLCLSFYIPPEHVLFC